MSSLDDLARLVPAPVAGAGLDWDAARAAMGFDPPTDYMEIVETYGAGLFAGEIAVWVPGGAGGEDLYQCAPPAVEELAESRDWIATQQWRWVEPDGATGPVDLGPDPIAFSAWGGGTSGCYGYWRQTSPDPNRWPVLYTDLRDLWFYHRGGIAAFIIDFLSGTWRSDQIELDLPDGPDFQPWAE